MADLGTAYVQIVPAATGIKGKISQAIAPEAALAGTQAGTTVARGMGARISSLGKGILKAGVIAGAVAVPIVAGIKKAMSAYEVQNAAETKLTEIYRKRMGVSKQAAQATIEYAGTLQKQGVVGDEVTLSGAQQLATFAKYPKTVNSLLPAMQNLLVQQKGLNGTSQDATQIANLMGKVMQGQTGALKRVGVSFTAAQEKVLKYGTEEEKAAMLSKVITQNVGEMNKAMLATPEGKIQQMKNSMGDLAESVGAMVAPALANIAQVISTTVIPKIQQFITMIQSSGIGAKIQAGITLVSNALKAVMPVISLIISNFMQVASVIASAVMPVLQTVIPIVSNIISKIVQVAQTISSIAIPIIKKVLSVVTPVMQGIMTVVGGALSRVLSVVTSVLNRVRSIFTTVWGGIKSFVSGAVNGIKTIIGGVSSVVGKVKSAFNAVKEAIMSPINKAKDLLSKVVNKIKNIFPVSLGKICNLKLPKIKISGGKAPWGIAGKGKKPSFDVTWAAQGGIMNTPTLVGAGEAGSEALLPLDPFWRKLDAWGNAISSFSDVQVVDQKPVVVSVQVDSKEIARAIAQPMQTEINKIETRNNRKLGYL